MSDQWSDPIYTDGDLDTAAACGLPVFSAPIAASTKEYLFTQEWMCSRKAFAITPLNTPHPSAGQFPDYSAYRLVDEGPRTDMGGGMVKWVRTYAIVPDSHDEFESYSYQFIGFQTFLGISIVGRNRFARIVTSRVAHDYFLVGAGGYPTAGDIPRVAATRYVAKTVGNAAPEPESTSDVEYLSNIGYPNVPYGTTPSRTQYEQWLAAAAADGWSAAPVGYQIDEEDLYDGTGGQIIAEDSRLTRWKGNIYLRQTRYILAQ
jgi:hypothetical protein